MKGKLMNFLNYIFSKRFFYDKYLIIALFFTIQINDLLLRVIIFDKGLSLTTFINNFLVLVLFLLILQIVKKKHQQRVLIFLMYFFSILAMSNYLYYSYFGNFLTLGQLSQTKQLADVASSILELLNPSLILFLIAPIAFHIGFRKIKNKVDLAPIHSRKKGIIFILVSFVLITGINALILTGADLSRLNKLWNRELVVEKFGVFAYQISDAYKVISSKYFANALSKEESDELFNNYYTPEQLTQQTNDYTGAYEGKDIYYIHYESAQAFLNGVKINGQEITPTMNRLMNDSVYFSNFYAQESYGTSSDTEFTISTSLYPLADGTVFVSEDNKNFISQEKFLQDLGYNVSAYHGNKSQFWNRNNMLPALGYDEVVGLESYEYSEEDLLGPWGLSDEAFYMKTIEKIKAFKTENPDTPIYSQLITLSNHHPFDAGAAVSTLDLNGFEEQNKEMSRYIKSLNYADQQLGLFFDLMEKQGLLDNAVIVIYGDHDARLSTKAYNDYYNYDFATGQMASEEEYVKLNKYDIKKLKRVPMLIYSKDEDKLEAQKIDSLAGMIDVQPTLNNLLGIYNPYQLGNDLLNNEVLPVVFPDGSWIYNDTYYNAPNEKYYGVILSKEELDEINKYAYDVLYLSNSIIHYDLQKDLIDFNYDDEIDKE